MKLKQLQITIVWLFLATLLMGTAIWQAQMAAARDLAKRRQTPPPPAKTRHAVRNPTVALTGDPVENYIAGCRKGMTRQEIEWILEDYHSAGLNLDTATATEAQLFAVRAAQQRWYRDLVVQAFQLDSVQKSQTTAKLAEIFQETKRTFLELKEEQKTSAARFQLVYPFFQPNEGGSFAEGWNPGFNPKNLCELTPAQQRLLARENEGFDPDDGFEFLPFLRSQLAIDHTPGTILPEALAMHPAQLKLELLVLPHVAELLQKEIAETPK